VDLLVLRLAAGHDHELAVQGRKTIS
jgi:hypothetical protein